MTVNKTKYDLMDNIDMENKSTKPTQTHDKI